MRVRLPLLLCSPWPLWPLCQLLPISSISSFSGVADLCRVDVLQQKQTLARCKGLLVKKDDSCVGSCSRGWLVQADG
jgi:hypothetical protein